MVAGVAEKAVIVGVCTWAGFTVTVTVFVAEPPDPIAVKVYVVVWLGVTVTELPVTVPMPDIEYEVALVAIQERMLDWPWVMVVGLAPNELIAGGVTVTVPTVTYSLAEYRLLEASLPETVIRWEPRASDEAPIVVAYEPPLPKR